MTEIKRIWIAGNIDEEKTEKIGEELFSVEHNQPVDIYLNSGGGHLDCGNALYDLVFELKETSRVRTIGLGRVFSTALTIFLASSNRVCYPRTMFMWHPGQMKCAYNAPVDIRLELDALEMQNREETEKLRKCARYMPLEILENKTGQERYFSAKQALEWKLITDIIGS